MRIIAGKYKGKKLFSPAKNVRPTLDRVKESIFSIVQDRIEDAVVLDLFCGSGALGLEAISRGAQSCDFVDKGLGSFKTVKKNIEFLGAEEQSSAYMKDSLVWLAVDRGKRYDLVFADPPYNFTETEIYKLLNRLLEGGLLTDDALIVLEKFKKTELKVPDGLILSDVRKYGDTEVALIRTPVKS